jgi:hypothetical protein
VQLGASAARRGLCWRAGAAGLFYVACLTLDKLKCKDISQGAKEVEEVGRYLLMVRTQYLFLVTFYYTYMEDHLRVQAEYDEFTRYA